MKHLLKLFIVCCVLASCVTEKQRLNICNNCPVKDSISYVERVVKHDTTIYINESLPPLIINNPCDSLGMLKKFDIVKHQNGLKEELKSDGTSITMDCEADSLKAVITQLVKEKSTKEYLAKEIHTTTNELTKFQGFEITGFWIIFIFVLIYFGVKYFAKNIGRFRF